MHHSLESLDWLPARTLYDEATYQPIERAAQLILPFKDDLAFCKEMTQLLLTLRSDAVLLAGGLLLRAWQSGNITPEEVEEKCAPEMKELLQRFDALSLIDHLHEQDKSDLEALRKMLLAMASDMRAVILKLASQVVAMREIGRYSVREQQRLAIQTRDLFAPLANRLGIAQIKSELEDSALRVLEPDIYQELTLALEEKRSDRERYIHRIIEQLEAALNQFNVGFRRIYGRVKHINSIYQKMKRKNLRFEQVNDVRAVRVEVDTQEQCYQVLSVVNELWVPVPEEFDDYIVHTKANGYQSLHCTLIGPENRVLEVQIRTKAMHEHAELGVAAHWKYKEKGAKHSRRFEQQIEWLRRLLEGKGDAKRGDVVFDQFRSEAFRDRVYAVTPQGRVVDLPEGATPLDFAYHVHTQLGHRCKGAKINGAIVPLSSALKNGDVVEILLHKNPNPSMDWLSDHLGYLQTGRAKAKVRSYFKKQAREKVHEIGKEMLHRELKRLNIEISNEQLLEVAQFMGMNSEEDIYVGIGFGHMGALSVVHRIVAFLEAKDGTEMPSLAERLAKIPIKSQRLHRRQNVAVEGMDDLMVNFASCCSPLPPCALLGFITQGRGVNIHRQDCQNMQHLAQKYPERIMPLSWVDGHSGLYAVDIGLLAYDHPDVLRDITQVFANDRVSILQVEMEQNQRQQLEGKFRVEVSDMSQLSRLMDRLTQVKNVLEAVVLGSEKNE